MRFTPGRWENMSRSPEIRENIIHSRAESTFIGNKVGSSNKVGSKRLGWEPGRAWEGSDKKFDSI